MHYALVSGSSTGIGRSLSLRLLREGITVFAGVRREIDAEAIESAARQHARNGATLHALKLDVTNAEQIQASIATVREIVGENGLWAVVNNAGIVVPGPVEHVSAEEWRKQFDVNFFGVIELTRATLPLLRKAVTAEGRFVPRLMLVSSIGGRVAQLLLSPYTSSKWALTSLGDSLRLELWKQGIGVTVLEPGAIKTEIWNKGDDSAATFTADHPAREMYGDQLDGLIALTRKTAASAISPEVAAESAVRALLKAKPPARVLVGNDAKIGAVLRKWLPLSWVDSLLRSQFKTR